MPVVYYVSKSEPSQTTSGTSVKIIDIFQIALVRPFLKNEFSNRLGMLMNITGTQQVDSFPLTSNELPMELMF